jgi:hypothetical protein
MTTDARRKAVLAAAAAVRECADTMEAQAGKVLGAIAGVPMQAGLRVKTADLFAALKDCAGRVTFEIALLETELGRAQRPDPEATRALVGLDAKMMEALAPLAELADDLERAAEHDPEQEPAFVLVIESAGVMLQSLDRARAATAAMAEG